jgi:6-phosphogluconolactonase
MGEAELIRFPNAGVLAEAAARRWLDVLEAANRRGAALHVALSGGRIARPFFAAFSALAQERRVSLERAHFFWADERCVPPDHPESNFRLAHETLLEPLHVARDRIHRIRGESPPAAAAAEASAELLRTVRERRGGQPVLDVVFLGMGEDGHVASLFPGAADAPGAGGAPYRAVVSPKPPPERVTLDYGPLAAAREVWVLVSGAGKSQALRASLSPQGRTPLARVIQSRPRTVLFTDLPAR